MTDIKLYETGNGGDARLLGKDLETIEGFGNMIYIGLFGGNPGFVTPPNRLPAIQDFSWWGNALLMPNDQSEQFNSLTEEALRTVALSSSGRIQIEQAILKDLQFMADFATIKATVEITNVDRIRITVQVLEPDNEEATEFIYIWDGTKQDLETKKPSADITIIPPYDALTAIGGTVTYDGDYEIHTMDTSDDFVVTHAGPGFIDEIELYGGGPGGGRGAFGSFGGGGGSGAERKRLTNYAISEGTFPVVIGAPGIGATVNNTDGTDGGDTTFDGNTAQGGSKGAGIFGDPGGNTKRNGGGGAAAGGLGGDTSHFDGGNASAGFGGGGGGGGEGGDAPDAPNTNGGGPKGIGVVCTIDGNTVERCKGGDGGGNTIPGNGLDGQEYGDGGGGNYGLSPINSGNAGNGKKGAAIFRFRFR